MRADQPLVSVVIPTYRRPDLVQEAIDSVLRQERIRLEILVVDDGSEDGTVDALTRRGAPVVPVTIPHCGRIGRVRNEGIRHARGALVAFLDSDDVWLPGKLARQLEHLDRHPDVAAVYTNQYRMRGGRVLPRTRFDEFPPRRRVRSRPTLLGMCVQTSSVLLRREVLETTGLFDEEFFLYEDLDMWSRISERYDWGFVETPLVVYRLDAAAAHLQHDERLKLREAWRFHRKYMERRRRREPLPDEDAMTACFVEAMAAKATTLGEPWPPRDG